MRPDQVSTALTAPPEVPLRAERWNLRPWSSRRRCMMPAPKTAWLPPPWQAIATRGTCAFALFRAKAEASSSINPGRPLTRLTMVSKLSRGSFYRVGLTFRRGQLDLPHGSACPTGSACPSSLPTLTGRGLSLLWQLRRTQERDGSEAGWRARAWMDKPAVHAYVGSCSRRNRASFYPPIKLPTHA